MVVSRRGLNAKRLRSAVQAVLGNEQYRCAARNVQASMRDVDGLQRAADIVEDVLRIASGNSLSESHKTVCAVRPNPEPVESRRAYHPTHGVMPDRVGFHKLSTIDVSHASGVD